MYGCYKHGVPYGEDCPVCRDGLNDNTAKELERIRMTESATKDDGGKEVRPELIAPEMTTALGTILAFGAKKYDAGNWAKGMDWSRCYGALQRHLNAWWSGEDSDPETGKSHLWHAACCLMFLIVYEARGKGKDDRKDIGAS